MLKGHWLLKTVSLQPGFLYYYVKLCSYCVSFKNNTRVKKRFEAFSFFVPCKSLRSTLMEVLRALKERMDPLFQKNDQDKGEFWFHFVKFKGKLNSGKEGVREMERKRKRASNNFFSCLLIASNLKLKIFYYYLVNKWGICIRGHMALWSLEDGLFACLPFNWTSYVWSATKQKKPKNKKYNTRGILSVHVRRKCHIKDVWLL